MASFDGRDKKESAMRQEDDVLRCTSIAELLGVADELLPEELAPPVDKHRIRAYLQRDKDCEDDVGKWIVHFQSWRLALAEVLAEDSQKDEHS
jgi:hypothetical protein